MFILRIIRNRYIHAVGQSMLSLFWKTELAYEITLLSVYPPIVARQRHGKNPLIVARQRLEIPLLLLGNGSVETLQR
jgi:hypothetical protein